MPGICVKCLGCGAEIAAGSEYCSGCGVKVSGLTIDYSHQRKKASDVYEVSPSEPKPSESSESFDEYDQHLADVMWVRFTLLLFALPVLGVISLGTGLVEKRTDLLYIGALFIASSVLAIALAVKFKFYKGEGSLWEKERREPPPRHFRRI